MPLLLIALSGAMLLFKDVLFVPDGWRVPPPAQAESDRELARLLAHPALAQAESLRLARAERGFHAVGMPDGLLTYWRIGADGPDPQPPLRLRLEHDVLDLHEHLLRGGVGDTLVRTIGPLVAVLLFLTHAATGAMMSNNAAIRDWLKPRDVGTRFGEWQRVLGLLGAIGLGRLVVLGVGSFLRRSTGAGTR